MVTGMECAGLVLAVLPLFLEVAKVYSDGAESIANVVIKSRWDGLLEDFYFDFYIQMVYLDRAMKRIRAAVNGAYGVTKNNLKTNRLFAEWHNDAVFESELKRYFGSDGSFEAFTRTSTKILVLLHDLIEDKANRMTAMDQGNQGMLNALKELAIERELDTTKSSFFERFAFFRHEKRRQKCITKLKRYTKIINNLTEQSGLDLDSSANHSVQYMGQSTCTKTGKSPASVDLRNLIATLYPVFQKHHLCDCTEYHQVKLCLKAGYNSDDLSPTLSIDFVLSKNLGPQHVQWQEGNVLVTSQCLNNIDGHTSFERLCQAFEAEHDGYSVALMVANNPGHLILDRGAPKLRQLQFLDSSDPISLGELLESSTKLDPSEKRRLALIFAESLLLYHDSHWLLDGWSKKDIHFFFRAEDEPDIDHPFLSAQFSNTPAAGDPTKNITNHGNVNILALGVLLIEIFNERPIEKWRTNKEKCSPSTTTLWMVADRVVKRMDYSHSRKAIEACLDLNWVPLGSSARLENPEIRKGLFQNVITPIKQELAWLSTTNPA